VPFDALEFDPVIASGDVLYDLAFLLMDLIERRLDCAANIVLNRYFAATRRPEDIDALAALPFFMSVRAAIRAKVTAARLGSADVTDRRPLTQAAQTYFRLAVDLISPPPPKLLAVGGLSGTGKSSLARALAPLVGPAPGAMVLRSDVERKQMFGVAETERLPTDAYSVAASARVYAAVADKAARIVAAGHSVIVDAVFAKADERAAIAAVASSANVAFRGLFLVADLKTRLERVGSRSLDASDADTAVARQQEAFELGRVEWAEIDASGPLPAVLSRARTAL
jgi:predicted kinase